MLGTNIFFENEIELQRKQSAQKKVVPVGCKNWIVGNLLMIY